jgi:type I restriction enzyme R subunit
VEKHNANTPAVFGNYIGICDIAQAVEDKVTVRIYYESRIAVDLYNAIIKLRPDWHNDDLDKGVIKVVMTSSSSDGAAIQKHHTTKSQRKALAQRLKDENDPLKIVIVRDMWLTGFDAPCMHTMYVDKPMKDHSLMRAIARVNRVFRDKPGGLIVDYIGIATNLKNALGFYAESGGKGVPAETYQKAVEIMLEKLEVVRGILHGFDYSAFFSGAVRDKLSLILKAEDFILGVQNGKNRFILEVTLLGQAYVLAKPAPETFKNAEEIAFLQAVKTRLTKFETNGTGRADSYDSVIRSIVNSAIVSGEVVDIFSAAGLEKPEISILSEEFLKKIAGMKYKNVAIELLRKLLSDEIRIRSRHNLAKSKTLFEMLDSAIKRYQNNLLTTAEIIEELIHIAREINASDKRGKNMGFTEDELAFYDALETNDSTVAVLGDEKLRTIAREIADKVRQNATIDFAIKETARARIMVIVRRILNKYGYPPDKQAAAIELVMKQAENLADIWVETNTRQSQ